MSASNASIKELADFYGRKEESLLPILEDVYVKNHLISEEAMVEIAKELDVSAAHVFGTATFYSFLETKPLGKYVIRVCKTITCMMHGKNQIIEELEGLLKVKVGNTTPDGLFTLLQTNCLGQCHKGPAMLINDQPFTNLTPATVGEIINQYIKREHASRGAT